MIAHQKGSYIILIITVDFETQKQVVYIFKQSKV